MSEKDAINSIDHTELDKQFDQGFALFLEGNHGEASEIYKKILNENPTHFNALLNLGLIAQINNNFSLALNFLSKAVQINPNDVVAHSNLGVTLKSLNRLEEAVASYDRAIEIQPNANAFSNRGNALRSLSRYLEAVASYDRAIEIQPKNAQTYYNRGLALKELNQLTAAADSFKSAIEFQQNFAEAHTDLGLALMGLNQLEEALANHDRAIEISPRFARAHINRSVTLKNLKRLNDAIVSLNSAIEIDPDSANAHYNLGNTYAELRQLDSAAACFNRAIEIQPKFSLAYSNRGNAFRELLKFEQAIASYESAISIDPKLAQAHFNLANCLVELKKIPPAIDSYDRAIEIQPEHGDFYWNKSNALLLFGEYEKGWQLYEWRWKRNTALRRPRHLNHPLWLGDEDINGKTILLHAEQGLGDTIQFCRYAKSIKALGAKVVLEVDKALFSLLAGLEGVDLLIEAGQPIPSIDFQCPLMSLPLACKTSLKSIPSPASYIKPDEVKVEFWKQKIQNVRGLKVGVVWNGGFRPSRPDLWDLNERRNIPLQIFSTEFNALEISFFSLQKGDPAESEMRNHETEFWPRGNFYNFASDLKDFSDTAALATVMDMVIGVDTSTVHLAAALGKTTWILNRYDNCWRWLVDRVDSPWYSSVKLYRQGPDRDWRPVLRKVADDLQLLALSRVNH